MDYTDIPNCKGTVKSGVGFALQSNQLRTTSAWEEVA